MSDPDKDSSDTDRSEPNADQPSDRDRPPADPDPDSDHHASDHERESERRQSEQDATADTAITTNSDSDPVPDPNPDTSTDADTDTSTGTNTDSSADVEADAEPVSEVGSGTGVGDNPDDRDPRDQNTQIVSEERRRNISLISAVVAVLGLWVAASLLIYDASEAAFWNNVLVGAVIFIAGTYNYYRLATDVPLSVGVATLAAVLGIWLIISAALFEMLGGLFWSTLATGLIVAGLSGYNAYEAREAQLVTGEETGA
ncbi:SPW repeat domain-containing protein [Natrialba chahannaoensis]